MCTVYKVVGVAKATLDGNKNKAGVKKVLMKSFPTFTTGPHQEKHAIRKLPGQHHQPCVHQQLGPHCSVCVLKHLLSSVWVVLWLTF